MRPSRYMRSWRRLWITGIVLMLAVGGTLLGQSRQSRGSRSPQSKQNQQPLNVLPNFVGILKSSGNKKLTLEGDDANSIEFNCSKKTKYFDGSKSITQTVLKPGDHLSVEARRAPDGTLDAVNVRLETKKPQQQ